VEGVGEMSGPEWSSVIIAKGGRRPFFQPRNPVLWPPETWVFRLEIEQLVEQLDCMIPAYFYAICCAFNRSD